MNHVAPSIFGKVYGAEEIGIPKLSYINSPTDEEEEDGVVAAGEEGCGGSVGMRIGEDEMAPLPIGRDSVISFFTQIKQMKCRGAEVLSEERGLLVLRQLVADKKVEETREIGSPNGTSSGIAEEVISGIVQDVNSASEKNHYHGGLLEWEEGALPVRTHPYYNNIIIDVVYGNTELRRRRMASTWRTLTDQYPEVLEEQRRSPIGIALEMTVNPISLGQLGQLTQLITTMLMRRYDNNWEEEVEASVAEALILEPTMQSFQGIVTPSHSRGIVSQLAWVLTVRMLTPFHSCCFKTCTSTLGNWATVLASYACYRPVTRCKPCPLPSCLLEAVAGSDCRLQLSGTVVGLDWRDLAQWGCSRSGMFLECVLQRGCSLSGICYGCSRALLRGCFGRGCSQSVIWYGMFSVGMFPVGDVLKAMQYASLKGLVNLFTGVDQPIFWNNNGNSRSLRIQQIKNYLSDMEIRGSAIDMPEFPSKLEWLNTAPLQFRRISRDVTSEALNSTRDIDNDLEFLEKKYADKPLFFIVADILNGEYSHKSSPSIGVGILFKAPWYATIRLCPFSIYLICGSLFFTSLAVSVPSASLKAVGHVCGSRAAVAEEASVGGSGEASSNSGAATPSVASTTSGTSDSKRLAVNAPGNRSDPGWKHGIAVDENPKKVQCKYCQKVINGGIYRLKHHLAGTQKDVGACKAVSDDVRKEMWKIVSSLQENLIKRAKEIEGRSSDSSPLGQYEDEEVEGAKRQRREIAKNPADLFKKRGVSSQTTINGIFKKNLREEACQGIASFFYNNAIPFHVAKSDEFKKMLDLVARHEKDLIRPATTRFATSYLTLGCLNDNKGALIRMFTSKEWKSSQFAKTKDGKVIENVVMDKDFWKSIITCLRSAYPLIKVLRCPNFKADFEVKRGIYDCLQRMVESMEEVKKIDAQLEDFKYRKKFFGSAVHTKRRNRLKAKTMIDVVFVMANSKLAKKKELRKVNDYSIDDLASDDDWIVDDSENLDLDASNEDLVPVEEEPSNPITSPALIPLIVSNSSPTDPDLDVPIAIRKGIVASITVVPLQLLLIGGYTRRFPIRYMQMGEYLFSPFEPSASHWEAAPPAALWFVCAVGLFLRKFTVVGVHSAKFDNEKDLEAIRSAVLRYNISHPVVNDGNMYLWRELGVNSWPTFVVVSPTGKVLLQISGEGHREDMDLDNFIDAALQFYGEKKLLENTVIPLFLEKDNDPRLLSSPLKFPGKLAIDELNNRLFISDSNHNRIVVTDLDGNFIIQVGATGEDGLNDGNFDSATFNRPQVRSILLNPCNVLALALSDGLIIRFLALALTFNLGSILQSAVPLLSVACDFTICKFEKNPTGLAYNPKKNLLYVADTENHALRVIDFVNDTVRTLAGNGTKGSDRDGGERGTNQVLNSPWDLCYEPSSEIVYIAMAGQHQIWEYNSSNGVTKAFSGDGYERNLNGSSSKSTSFAQPSGITLAPDLQELYVADSESSSIRAVDLKTGGSRLLAGGDPLFPDNLFRVINNLKSSSKIIGSRMVLNSNLMSNSLETMME
ncbi:hypothetical protein ZIOFF_075414 [Zingiber officinale]|uniref:BED-type domain-containing protein n=1 Tax=Zingiber officinale TaxID=94328 RepID=A0A8J5EKX6_ZINOF|nr:hypothetical protein ZIOFF_075414 [Zingiber officinale]